jgi:SP family general alpha glucoside:H+ symporter-like MFS transporter
MMKHTNDCEKRLHAGTSYLECFKGVNLRRTEIACVTWAMQNLCGNAFMGYSTYFFTQAGLPEAMSFNMSIVQYAIGLVGTLSSWFLMPKFGRRTLYLYGMAALCLLMAIIGFVGFAPKSNPSASWAIGAMLLLWTLVYDVTIGPVCYSLVAELPSTRLRIKTVVLARFVYNIGGIFNYSVTPYMLNPTGWNWGAKTGIFWAGMCALGTAWIYFRLPEPKGRTYGELDVLFANKVSARKFSSTKVDVARSSSVAIADDQNEKPNVLHVDGI